MESSLPDEDNIIFLELAGIDRPGFLPKIDGQNRLALGNFAEVPTYPTFRTSRIEKIAITDMGAEQANNLLVNRAKVEHLTERWLPIHPDG